MSRRRRRVKLIGTVVGACLGWLAAGYVTGQSPRPATAPSTAPAVPADNTPKGVMRQMADAMRAGDAGKIKSLLYWTNPAEEKMASAVATMAEAIANLHKAAIKVYGESGARGLTGDTAAAYAEGMKRLAASKEMISGDQAIILPASAAEADDDRPTQLQRVAGQWKIPVSELRKQAGGDASDVRIEELTTEAKLINEAAREIAANKYKTSEEAARELQQKMMHAAMQTAQPPAQDATPAGPPAPVMASSTTRPATRPATTAAPPKPEARNPKSE